jgi:hypothetical protein
VLSVLLQLTTSEYPFGIFKHIIWQTKSLYGLTASDYPLVSSDFSHKKQRFIKDNQPSELLSCQLPLRYNGNGLNGGNTYWVQIQDLL